MARIPWHRTVIYEAHVRGMTTLHPEVPVEERGTFAGFAHDAVIGHLVDLGVTTVELMPIFSFEPEPFLSSHGLTNYWGYNTRDYFTVHPGYAAGQDAAGELAAMVERLHEAGLEVLLDVVFNHTAADALPESWYRREGRHLVDFSGCGNTPDSSNPLFQDMVVRCLRAWHDNTGVDGFRFDLASALSRDSEHRMSPPGELFERIAYDRVLSRLKLIVEPWDATADGYALGRFGPPYAEWNDRFRDDVRDFWRGRGNGVKDLATRLGGSSDLVESPSRSINFVTSHDGFTLRDVVSYTRKHNSANGEDERDGHDDNRSDNFGVEGETDDPAVVAARQARARAMLATLLMSRGVPMIRMGDEFGHTQGGNNNAYCQDNAVSWMRWHADPGWDLREHIAKWLGRRASWVGPHHLTDDDVDWIRERDWEDRQAGRLGMRRDGRTLWLDAADGTVEFD